MSRHTGKWNNTAEISPRKPSLMLLRTRHDVLTCLCRPRACRLIDWPGIRTLTYCPDTRNTPRTNLARRPYSRHHDETVPSIVALDIRHQSTPTEWIPVDWNPKSPRFTWPYNFAYTCWDDHNGNRSPLRLLAAHNRRSRAVTVRCASTPARLLYRSSQWRL